MAETSNGLEISLDVDPEELSRSTYEINPTDRIGDDVLRRLRRDSRLAISWSRPRWVDKPDLPSDRVAVDVPLMFALHAHPDCSFNWARVIVDFTPTSGSHIEDMSPREVENTPVDIETKIGRKLGFALATTTVTASAESEVGRKRTVFFPDTTASGVGFRQAVWDFHGKAVEHLHVDRELRILVSHSRNYPLMASITVRANVRMRGLARYIPLLGRTGGITSPSSVYL